MINEIKITDLSKAEGYSFNSDTKYDIWISAVDKQDRRKTNRMKTNFNSKGVHYYAQHFYDWSDEDGHQWKHLEPEGPQEKHVKNFITFLTPFVNDNKIHNLGVNCFAGISRSSALAIVALVMSGKTIDNALDYVLSVRPEAWPNLRILGFASQILGKDIKTHIANWKKQVLGEEVIITSYDDLRKLNRK